MNYSNHYKHLSDEILIGVTMVQADAAAYCLASRGYITMSELNDLGNMLLMGWEMGL